MKALLIYPKIPDTFWSLKYALRFAGRKSYQPPLGLLTFAAMLPEAWEKQLLDMNVDDLTEQALAWADCAFVGGMGIQQESAHQVVTRCHEAGLNIVAGGPFFTNLFLHGEADESQFIRELQDNFKDVDHLILNEAELTLPPFLEDLERNHPRYMYTTTDFADIQGTPVPLWDLIDMKQYQQMSIQFSRGCPNDCDFCDVTLLFGHYPRTKTADQVITELDALYCRGWKGGVFFVDDNFIANKAALKNDLLPVMIEWRKGKEDLVFSTQVTIDLADDDDLMRMMTEAGFNTVFIGIETPCEESLIECRKKRNTNRNLVEDVRHIHRSGLQVGGGFIIGFDNDTPSIFQQQIDFIQESGVVIAMAGLLQAPPATRLFNRLKQEGRLIDRISGDNANGETNVIPVMGYHELRTGYDQMMRHLYSPENYYRRIRTFLSDYKASNNQQKVKFEHFWAFLHTVFHLGIRQKGRCHFWALLSWVSCHHPGKISIAVTLAIIGYHFRKMNELRSKNQNMSF